MKVSENKIDTKSIIDFTLLVLLLVSFIYYIETSSEFQNLISAIKYNSNEALDNGLAVLGTTGK